MGFLSLYEITIAPGMLWLSLAASALIALFAKAGGGGGDMQAEYRVLFEEANDAMFVADAETGIVVDANTKAGELLGLPLDKVIGMHQSGMHTEDKREQYALLFAKAVKQEPTVIGDIFVQHSGGREVPVEISSSVIEWKGKKSVLGVFRDMTERKQVEEELRAQRDRARTYFDIAEVMLVAIGRDWKVTLINKKGCDVLGYAEHEIIGRDWFENFLPEHWRKKTGKAFDMLVSGDVESVEYFENPVLTRSGQERTIAWRNTVLRNERGEITGILGSGEDVTEKMAMQDKLRRAEEVELTGRLAAGIAHEVRNPLNAIMAIVEALSLEFKEKPEYVEFLTHIRLQVMRLSEVTTGLLEFAKPEQENLMHRVGLAEVCSATVNYWRSTEPEKRNEVKIVDKCLGVPAFVVANATRLEQVFLNIIKNASQHSPEGSEILITIDQPKDGMVCVSVSDHGQGVPAEAIPKVFEPFFTTRRKGTGLGLSIVKKIIEGHGGFVILFNNDPGPGCTIRVCLPTEMNNSP